MRYGLCLFVIFALTGIIASVNAQDAAPEEYTVKKGDTLWDISDAKLDDSFLWPYLWRTNPGIGNPDLIYPGDMLLIPSREELMRLPFMPRKAPVAAKPEIPEVMQVAEKPDKFIVNRTRYLSSGWISAEFPATGEIMSAPSTRNVFGRDDEVYIKSADQVSIGDRLYAIRLIKKVFHPATGTMLGHQIRITGLLEITGMDGRDRDVPKARIVESYEDLQIGDGTMPYMEKEPPVIPDVTRTPDVQGYIVESHMNTQLVFAGDIVYLDKGLDDGLQIGDTFTAFTQIPVERSVGRLQVFSLQPTTSVAVLSKTNKAIAIGDLWGNR